MSQERTKEFLAGQIKGLVVDLVDKHIERIEDLYLISENISEVLYTYRLLMDIQITEFKDEDAERVARSIVEIAQAHHHQGVLQPLPFSEEDFLHRVKTVHEEDLMRAEMNTTALLSKYEESHERTSE